MPVVNEAEIASAYQRCRLRRQALAPVRLRERLNPYRTKSSAREAGFTMGGVYSSAVKKSLKRPEPLYGRFGGNDAAIHLCQAL